MFFLQNTLTTEYCMENAEELFSYLFQLKSITSRILFHCEMATNETLFSHQFKCFFLYILTINYYLFHIFIIFPYLVVLSLTIYYF